MLLWLFWVLCLLPTVICEVYPHPLKDFRSDCLRRNNDGNCDLKCRNLVGNSEFSDCSPIQLICPLFCEGLIDPVVHYKGHLLGWSTPFGHTFQKTINRTFSFDVYDISFASIVAKENNRSFYCHEWRNNFGIIMRKAMEIEVELLITDEELVKRGVECVMAGGVTRMDFIFSLTFPICPTCASLEEIISRLTSQDFTEMHIRYEPSNEKSKGVIVIVLVALGLLLLVLAAVKVLLPIISTSRKFKVKSAPIWMPPVKDDKDSNKLVQNWTPSTQFGYYSAYNLQHPPANVSSSNISFTSQDPLLQFPDVVVAQRTQLHEIFLRNLSEDQMISEVDRLLELKIDINGVTERSETALAMAVRRGKVFLAEHLIKKGAKTSISDSNGFSLLHNAVAISDLKMLKTLLKYEAIRKEIDELSKNGRTALMECALVANEDIGIRMATALIDKNAQLECQGERGPPLYSGMTVLHYAAQMGFSKMIHFLVRKAYENNSYLIDIQDFSNKSALFYACDRGCFESAKALLENGANQHLSPMEINNLPITAAKEGFYEDIVRLLNEYRDKAKEEPKKRRGRRTRQIPSTPSSTSSSPINTSGSPQTENSNSSNCEASPTLAFPFTLQPPFNRYHPYQSMASVV